jgi:hypothetical protein
MAGAAVAAFRRTIAFDIRSWNLIDERFGDEGITRVRVDGRVLSHDLDCALDVDHDCRCLRQAVAASP